MLPGKLTGPAYLVSHGGAGFPDLDLVLRGDGVEVVLVGHTQIKAGIISSKFETLPDAPITSATVTLPVGPRSLLAANGNLCRTDAVCAHDPDRPERRQDQRQDEDHRHELPGGSHRPPDLGRHGRS